MYVCMCVYMYNQSGCESKFNFNLPKCSSPVSTSTITLKYPSRNICKLFKD